MNVLKVYDEVAAAHNDKAFNVIGFRIYRPIYCPIDRLELVTQLFYDLIMTIYKMEDCIPYRGFQEVVFF